MLLIIEALLLIVAALGQDHRAAAAVEEEIFPLDMAPDSVDDQYYGCIENMTHLVKTKYLEKERNASDEFNYAWQEAEKNAKKAEDNLQQINSVAIHVYSNHNYSVYSDFTSATRTDKQKYKEGTFKWYSLHFLLTEAIQILKKTHNRCYDTYRGTDVTIEFKDVKEVRLSSFSSSSLKQTVAQNFGNKSCFVIHTCEGANLTKYSKYPEQKEVLIPPYETFKVTAVMKRTYQPDLWCDTVFVLNSTGKTSYMNCALFNSGHHVAFFNVLLILPLLFCQVFTC